MAFRNVTDQIGIETDTGSSRNLIAGTGGVSKGQLVTMSGDRTVVPSSTDGEACYGVAAYDAAAGESVLVYGPGCVVLGTSGTGSISAGDFVASDGDTGEEGEFATAATADSIVGKALEDDEGDGDDVVVELAWGDNAA